MAIARLLLVAALLLGAAACRPADEPAPRRPNVVLISIDSLRADHLGAYGYERPTSPNLDELARQGALFEQAIASTSWTLPSHASIFTSLDAATHGVDTTEETLPPELPLLAEVLRDSGYATVGCYTIGLLGRSYGFHRGFDRYYNCTSHIGEEDDSLDEFRERFGPGAPKPKRAAFVDVTSPRIHETAAHWLENERREPFFMFLHYFDVHFDYVPPPPYDTLFLPDGSGQPGVGARKVPGGVGYQANPGVEGLDELVALYDGEIRFTDEWIGRLLDLLREEGLLEHTLVIVTADHGEEFGLHGAMYHGNNLFDETLRVPLLVRLPGVARPGARIGQQVRSIDLYPTILELAGIEPGAHVAGRSLVPLLEGRSLELPPARSSLKKIPWHRKNVPSESLRVSGGKVVRASESGERAYFDLAQDPDELSGIAVDADAPPEATRLSALLDAAPSAATNTDDNPDVELDPVLRERLRELGYVE